MKRIAFVVSIFVMGLGLIYFGWKLWNAPPLSDSSVAPAKLKEVEKITVQKQSLTGKILVADAGKLQLLDPETSALSEVDPVLSRIPGTVISVSQSPSQNFWIISALTEPAGEGSEVDPEELPSGGQDKRIFTHPDWYLLDWSTNELKNLTTVFAQQQFLENKSISQLLWNEDSSEMLISAIDSDTRKVTLATLNPKVLNMRERQTITENTKELVVYTSKNQTVFFTERQEGKTQLVRQDLISGTTTQLSTQSFMKVLSNQSKTNAIWNSNTVQLFDINTPSKILATIRPTSGQYIFEEAAVFSLNGETLGLVERQTTNPEMKIASFFSSTGKLLAQTPPREGSITSILSPNGQTAVLTISKVSTHETIAPIEWYFFDIYANREKPIVGLQEKSISILEML